MPSDTTHPLIRPSNTLSNSSSHTLSSTLSHPYSLTPLPLPPPLVPPFSLQVCGPSPSLHPPPSPQDHLLHRGRGGPPGQTIGRRTHLLFQVTSPPPPPSTHTLVLPDILSYQYRSMYSLPVINSYHHRPHLLTLLVSIITHPSPPLLPDTWTRVRPCSTITTPHLLSSSSPLTYYRHHHSSDTWTRVRPCYTITTPHLLSSPLTTPTLPQIR